MKYRVTIKIAYHVAYFDFEDAAEACNFATSALMHSVSSEDQNKAASIMLRIINSEMEEEEED